MSYDEKFQELLANEPFEVEEAKVLVAQYAEEYSQYLNDVARKNLTPPKDLGKVLKNILDIDPDVKFSEHSIFAFAYYCNIPDEQLVELISDDQDTQLKQLKYVLGLMYPSPSRMCSLHTNNCIKTQKVLIKLINNRFVLKDILREFTIRPMDTGGAENIINAAVTVRMFVDEGVDVNATTISEKYESGRPAGTHQHHDGKTIIDIILPAAVIDSTWGVCKVIAPKLNQSAVEPLARGLLSLLSHKNQLIQNMELLKADSHHSQPSKYEENIKELNERIDEICSWMAPMLTVETMEKITQAEWVRIEESLKKYNNDPELKKEQEEAWATCILEAQEKLANLIEKNIKIVEEPLNELLNLVVDIESPFLNEEEKEQLSQQAEEIAQNIIDAGVSLQIIQAYSKKVDRNYRKKDNELSKEQKRKLKQLYKIIEKPDNSSPHEATKLLREILQDRADFRLFITNVLKKNSPLSTTVEIIEQMLESVFYNVMTKHSYFFEEQRTNVAEAFIHNEHFKRAYDAEDFDINKAILLINQFLDANNFEIKHHSRYEIYPPKLFGKLLQKIFDVDPNIKFKNNLSAFEVAYLCNIDDDELAAFISNDPEERKTQLKYTLGVMHPNSGRMVDEHRNNRLNTQEVLLEEIKDEAFLSSVLRDFIVRPNDTGQVIRKDAYKSIEMLITAGANVNETHLDENYQSPGTKFVKKFDGASALTIVMHWNNKKTWEFCTPIIQETNVATQYIDPWHKDDESKYTALDKLLKLRGYQKGPVKLYLKEFVRTINLISSTDDDEEKAAQELRVDELVSELFKVLTVENLPEVFQELQNEMDDDNIEALWEAETRLLEKIYDKEEQERQRFITYAKRSLWFSILVLPLIATAVFAIIYAVKKHISAVVKAKDMSYEKFEKTFGETSETDIELSTKDSSIMSGKESTYAQINKLPVKEKDGRPVLRKAVVFNEDKLDDSDIGTSRFSFASHLHDSPAALEKDVRVYTVANS